MSGLLRPTLGWTAAYWEQLFRSRSHNKRLPARLVRDVSLITIWGMRRESEWSFRVHKRCSFWWHVKGCTTGPLLNWAFFFSSKVISCLVKGRVSVSVFVFLERILRVSVVVELWLAHHAGSAEKKKPQERSWAATSAKLIENMTHECPLKAFCFRVSQSRWVSSEVSHSQIFQAQ